MSYAIDTWGTRQVGSTLLTTGDELRDCGTTLAYAAGLARRGVAADHPALTASVQDVLDTHRTALELITTGCAALGGSLTWAARSAHEVELSAALELGARGLAGSADPLDPTRAGF
jgi:hypothetical protein